jgi:hypothetical protein
MKVKKFKQLISKIPDNLEIYFHNDATDECFKLEDLDSFITIENVGLLKLGRGKKKLRLVSRFKDKKQEFERIKKAAVIG